MNTNPQVSIIIPVYNTEKYLTKCIESILKQDYTDFELLLIDDGSKDKSGLICDKYAKKDKRIKVFHKENGGVSSARNLGIEKSKGKYISFVDADDEVRPTYLNKLNNYIQQSDIVFFPSIWIHEDKSKLIILADNFYSEKYDSIEQEILLLMKNDSGYNLFGYTWNKIFKADIIKEKDIKFIDNLAVSEDEIFTLDYCRFIKSMMVISTPLYNYYRKNNSLTHKKKEATEWLLLAHHFQKLSDKYNNKYLKKYLLERITTYLLYAIKCLHPYNYQFYQIHYKLIRLCKKNNISIPYKSILKIFITKIYKRNY